MPKKRTSGSNRAPDRILQQPVFSQPQPTADPGTFQIRHPSDNAAYKAIDELNREHKLNASAVSRAARRHR